MRQLQKGIALLLLLFSVLVSGQLPEQVTEEKNRTSSASYDIRGHKVAEGISYYDDMGKPTVSLSRNLLLNDTIVGSETRYDIYGRPEISSFAAPISDNGDFRHPQDASFTLFSPQVSDNNIPKVHEWY